MKSFLDKKLHSDITSVLDKNHINYKESQKTIKLIKVPLENSSNKNESISGIKSNGNYNINYVLQNNSNNNENKNSQGVSISNLHLPTNIFKKYFLYKLKTILLQSRKYIFTKKNINFTSNESFPLTFQHFLSIKLVPLDNHIIYENKSERINNYILFKNKVLGRGGFSVVCLCQDIFNNQFFAMKIIDKKKRANKSKTLYDYVKEEINILKRVHSKYIVGIEKIIESDSTIYIVMEYMKNNMVFSHIENLKEFQIWRYFRHLICAVEHCHEIAKIVHRDINVNNLLISDDDIAKLIDFGISLEINEDDSIPCEGPCTYTPPEKLFSKEKSYHGKPADLWLCGVTLYHMVYKEPLFKDFGNLSIDDYKNIRLPENDEIDINLQRLILSLLEFDPEKRPTINEIKGNKWTTHDGEFPFPNIFEEALEFMMDNSIKQVRDSKVIEDCEEIYDGKKTENNNKKFEDINSDNKDDRPNEETCQKLIDSNNLNDSEIDFNSISQ